MTGRKRKPSGPEADIGTQHQVRIAKSTLRLSDIGAMLLGGMDKTRARAVLRKQGWTDERIRKWEDGTP